MDRNNYYDIVYSRFTLHSINSDLELKTIKNANKLLCNGGVFMIEARTIYDDYCGKGEMISENEWIYEGHYRRFINPPNLIKNLQDTGFIVRTMEISNDLQFIKTKNQNAFVSSHIKNKTYVIETILY